MYEKKESARKVGLVLLAAGDSRRFGRNKLLELVGGRPMYRWVADEAAALPKQIFCQKILVSQYPEILSWGERFGFETVENRESSLGISHSVHLGLLAARAGGADAVCFSVCDQPWLKKETIKALIEGWEKSGKGLGTVCFQGRDGNPAVFSSQYFPELLTLSGDRGGRKILQGHPEDVYRYEVADGMELEDVDVPERIHGLGDRKGKNHG